MQYKDFSSKLCCVLARTKCEQAPASLLASRNKKPRIQNTEYRIRNTASRGFTLMELVVVMAIIVVVTSVTLANNSRFGGTVLLQNLAYDIALSIRQAQVYGISVRNYGSGNFNALYGMHFNVGESTQYALFADASGTGVYDPSKNLAPSPYVIGRGYYIAGICSPAGASPSACTRVSQLDIIYKRPEPDARITAGDGSGQTCIQNPSQCRENARVILESPRGDTMSVVVDVTGQISVQ